MKKRCTLLFFCLLVMTAACRSGSDRSPIVATMNGHEIHRSDFERFLQSKMADLNASETSDAVRSQMLDDYIKRRLVLDAAARAGLTITDAEMEQSAEDNPQLKSTVASEATREEMTRDLLVEKYYRQVALRDVRVSPDEVQQYIEKNQFRLTDRPGFLVREIRVQTRADADRFRSEVTVGHRDFASVARLHSDAPNAEHNGLTRYDEGQLPGLLEKAIQQLRPGDVSPVIESNYGFHIFKLEQRLQPHAPEERRSQLDDRRSALADELISRKNQEAVDRAIERLMAETTIKINESALGFTYLGRLGHN